MEAGSSEMRFVRTPWNMSRSARSTGCARRREFADADAVIGIEMTARLARRAWQRRVRRIRHGRA